MTSRIRAQLLLELPSGRRTTLSPMTSRPGSTDHLRRLLVLAAFAFAPAAPRSSLELLGTRLQTPGLWRVHSKSACQLAYSRRCGVPPACSSSSPRGTSFLTPRRGMPWSQTCLALAVTSQCNRVQPSATVWMLRTGIEMKITWLSSQSC